MDFKKWLSTLPGSPTPSLAAKASGLANPTLLRHADRGYSTADNVIVIARAYGVNIIDALVENDFLKPDETNAERLPTKEAFKRATVSEILEALVEAVNSAGIMDGNFDKDDITNTSNDLAARRARRAVVADVPEAEVRELSEDELVAKINAGEIKVAAQKRTEPIEESWS